MKFTLFLKARAILESQIIMINKDKSVLVTTVKIANKEGIKIVLQLPESLEIR